MANPNSVGTSVVVFVILLSAAPCGVQAASPATTAPATTGMFAGKKPPNAKTQQQVARITSLLQTNDDAQVEEGVQEAIFLVNFPGNAGSFENAGKGKYIDREAANWQKLLLQQKRADLGEELALNVITGNFAFDAAAIERWQEFRVRMKLAAGKPQEALLLAKSYYNVSTMPHTNKAIDLICSCLYEINKAGDPIAAVKQFKLEQVQGATAPSTTQPNAAGATSLTLSAIKIDPATYQDGIDQADGDIDIFRGLMAKGNLLLLADRGKEAKDVFQKAYSLATDKTMAAATEALARSMRAEDGTVGRANQFILSLRPQDPAQ